MEYKCKHCGACLDTIAGYIRHVKMHRNEANFSFPCGVADCLSLMKTTRALQSHMYQNHAISKPVRDTVNFSCQVETCSVLSSNFSSLCEHLKSHISDGERIVCPFNGCELNFTVKSSFTSHISRKHRNHSGGERGVDEAVEHNDSSIDIGNDELTATIAFPQCSDSLVDDRNVFLTNLALFYLRMQAKMLLPASTISTLIEEFQEVCTNAVAQMFVKLRQELTELGIPLEKISNIIDGLSKENLLAMYNEGLFRSDATRKTYFKKNFNYVEPIPVRLGFDASGKERFYHYVPVKDTLNALLNLPSVREQWQVSQTLLADPNMFEDVRDGKNFKENSLLQQFPSSISIILYQDAFEVVNPLGSGRKKHKLLAVYMTLGEILPYNRSSIDPIQLVMLCRESDYKFFGQHKVFSFLVQDLKDLEISGVTVVAGETVKGALVAVAGDNLGSHSLGGFVENFSRSKHFCRYCLISRDAFVNDPMKLGPPRTPENYKSSVEELALVDEKPVNGIKFDSVFNELEHFHVCQPGLPPCLGHDLFEGVVAVDVQLYLKHLVHIGKHFTFVQLNRKIGQMELKGSDSNNRPCVVKADGEKLGGSAAQNWCLLRLLPVLVGTRVKNPFEDQVWMLCLKLRVIVELVCAPKIHSNQVAYLKLLVEEYLELRAMVLSDHQLKPKHHFLLHYPGLILKFGPLIRLWTLRFESKHTYFKQCARKLQNFKNLCSTLAERHQLLQAYLHAGNLFPPVLQVGQASEFDFQMYNPAIKEAVRGVQKQFTMETISATYKGTVYRKGMAVILGCTDSEYEVGKIALLLVSQGMLYFVCEKLRAVSALDLGIHIICKDTECCYVCVSVDNLADYYPLPLYRLSEVDVLILHHSVFSDS